MAPRAAARLEAMGFKRIHEYKAGKLDWLASGLPTEGESSKHPRAADVARKDVIVCALRDRLGDVQDRVRSAGAKAAVVADGDRVVLGLLGKDQLAKDSASFVEEAMKPGPSTFRPYVSIKEMADYMVEHRLEAAPITTSDGRLVGVLYKSDAVDSAEGCPDCVRKMI